MLKKEHAFLNKNKIQYQNAVKRYDLLIKNIFTVEGKGGDLSVDKFSFFSIFSLLLETLSISLSEFVSLYSSSS